MAARLKMHTINDGAELVINSTGDNRKIATGLALDLDVNASDPDSMVLEKAYNLLEAEGYVLNSVAPGYSANSGMILRQITVRPVGPPDQARVYCLFSREPFGGQVSAYFIRRTTVLANVTRNTIPGTYEPIKVGFIGVSSASYAQGQSQLQVPEIVPVDYVTFNVPTPQRALAISGLKYGSPPAYDDFVGMVNNAFWNGKDVGYWQLFKYEANIARYAGYYQYEAVATSRNIEDYSEIGILFNKKSGKYVEVPDATIAQMLSLPYKKGIIYPTDAASANSGVVRVGFADMTDFSDLFGFTNAVDQTPNFGSFF